MNKTPQDLIKYLRKAYTEDDKLTVGDIIHIRDSGKHCQDENGNTTGYYDANFFTLTLYNFTTYTKRIIHNRDEITLDILNPPFVQMIRVYCNGETIIRFRKKVKLDIFQSVSITNYG